MEPNFRNNTKLTLDLYKYGITESFNASHRLLRAISLAYGVIMILVALKMLDYNTVFCILFLLLGIGVLFFTLGGYRLGTKRSFLNFAKMHGSHYQVDMEFRFYEDRLEQETKKTELTVMYKDFKEVCNLEDVLVFLYNKHVIIMEKSAFIDCDYEDVIKFLKEKNVRIRRVR